MPLPITYAPATGPAPANSLLQFLYMITYDAATKAISMQPGGMAALSAQYGFDLNNPALHAAIGAADAAAVRWINAKNANNVALSDQAELEIKVNLGAITATLYEELLSSIFPWIW